MLLLPLDLECPSLPGVEVKPRWAWQGAGLGCRSFWQAFGGSHVLCIQVQPSPGKLHGRGSRGASHGSCGHKTSTLLQSRRCRWDGGGERSQDDTGAASRAPPASFGGDFPPSGHPQSCVAAPAEVSSSCAIGGGCGAGSAAQSLLGALARGQLWEGSPHSHQNPSREEAKAPIPLSQSLPLCSARWVPGHGALGVAGCPQCWQCSGACPQIQGHLLVPSPRVEDGDADPAGCLLQWKKKCILGMMTSSCRQKKKIRFR